MNLLKLTVLFRFAVVVAVVHLDSSVMDNSC